jgi:hypothetical protein
VGFRYEVAGSEPSRGAVTCTGPERASEDSPPKAASNTVPAAKGSLGSRASYAAAWSLVGFGGGEVVRLGGNLILQRLLFPEAFGLMVIANVLLQGLMLFPDLGIGPSIVQNQQGTINRLRWHKPSATMLINFGKWIFVSTALTFFAGQSDRLIFAKLIPIDMLGIYGMAAMIALLPSSYSEGSNPASSSRYTAQSTVKGENSRRSAAGLDSRARTLCTQPGSRPCHPQSAHPSVGPHAADSSALPHRL